MHVQTLEQRRGPLDFERRYGECPSDRERSLLGLGGRVHFAVPLFEVFGIFLWVGGEETGKVATAERRCPVSFARAIGADLGAF